MFTGIIEEIGILKYARSQGKAMVLGIAAKRVVQDVHIGDSIAVNGVCLTVISHDRGGFAADVMPETFRKTTLHQLKAGSKVNLERALSANGRFGGHMVQGHVDGQATIISRRGEDNAVVFGLQPEDPELLRYTVNQGSIAVDGISLTIAKVLDRSFTVSIIPHTLTQTVLINKKVGDSVNLECDILGKYMFQILQGRRHPDIGADSSEASQASKITVDYLAEHGFI